MKSAIAISAFIASDLAEFQLTISGASSDLNGRALITQGDALIVASSGEHGINFTGGDGSLGIENGDSTSEQTATSTSRAPTASLAAVTDGFTTSGSTLTWAQGSFYACAHESFYAAGPPTYMIYADRGGATLPSGCSQVTLTETAI